jgi:hypothetical protein
MRLGGPSRGFVRVRLNPEGAIGFDGDDELVAAYRGAQAHAKTRARLIANDNAIALAA